MVLGACGSRSTPPPPTAQSAADQAENATGQVAVLLKDVQTIGYDSGKATQCSILYNVLNNTSYHLYSATTDISGYSIDISDLSANSHFKTDQTLTVDPVNGSCAGVADKLIQSGGHLGTTTCQMEKLTEGDCQTKVAGYVSIDRGTEAKLQQADQTAAQQLAAQQAQQFQQAKAQAWAERGQFEAPIGAAFASANPSTPLSLPVVLAPDFDPSKLVDGSPVATSNVDFCPPDPTSGYPSDGKLTLLAIVRDQYGLASWYKMKVSCPGSTNEPAWINASAFDVSLQQGQLSKLK
jgi:hypothetical protein